MFRIVGEDGYVVVVDRKPPFKDHGSQWDVVAQFVTVRPASEADLAALVDARKAD